MKDQLKYRLLCAVLLLVASLIAISMARGQVLPGPGFLTKPTVATNDPNFASVKLLMKSSGSTFVDASSNAYTLATDANTAQSTDVPYGSQKSFSPSVGTSRLIVSTSGVNLNPGTSNFTVESWIKIPLTGADSDTFIFSRSWSGANYIVFYVSNSGAINFIIGHPQSGWTTLSSAASTVPANQWRHVAFVRSGTTISTYANGTRVATATMGSVIDLANSNTGNPAIGGYAHSTYGMNNGKLYDFRVTFMARYSGTTYTIPTAPFPTN